MRYKTAKTKNTVEHTIIQDITRNEKRTTCVYENLGNYDKLKLRAGDEDPITWLNNYVEKLNKKKITFQLLSKKIPIKSLIKMYKLNLILDIFFFKTCIIVLD